MTNKKAKGKRSKTRRKMKSRGKQSLNALVAGFGEKQRVNIDIDPSVHSGLPSTKYQGFSGVVSGKRGAAYEVDVKDGGLSRTLIVGAAHLKGDKGEAS